MVSDNNEDQKLRWQKIKKELQNKLNQKERVKTNRFDELTDVDNSNIINKREYPVGAESILVEAENSKKTMDIGEIKKLANLQASIKKVSEVLKKNTIQLKPEDPVQQDSNMMRELTHKIAKEEWDSLYSKLKSIQQGEQPRLYSELALWIVDVNSIIQPHIDLVLTILDNAPDDHNFSIILSSSFLVAVRREEDEELLDLLIIRFSKSKKELIMLFMDELPNEKEKKELLVSFLLGQNPKFAITDKEAKKLAFQKSIANKKLKN